MLSEFSKKRTLLLLLAFSFLLVLWVFVRDQDGSVLSTSVSVFSNYIQTKNEREFKKSLETRYGDFGLYIVDLNTQKEYSFNKNQVFYAASLYKLPIAVATLRQIQTGDLAPYAKVEFLESDHIKGSGTVSDSEYGTFFNVTQLLTKLIRDSDNSAQVMLERTLDRNVITQAFNLSRGANSTFYSINESAPEEIGNYIIKLIGGDYLNGKNKEKLLELMSSTSFDNRISPYLESGIFSHKIGSWPQDGSWHDCGLVQNDKLIVVCLMSKNTTFEEFLKASRSTAEFINSL